MLVVCFGDGLGNQMFQYAFLNRFRSITQVLKLGQISITFMDL